MSGTAPEVVSGWPEATVERAAEAITVHELKTWPEFLTSIISGEKTFEVRFDDRGIEVGDVLWLRGWDPQGRAYTSEEAHRRVTYRLVLRDTPGSLNEALLDAGASGEWIVLGLAPTPRAALKVLPDPTADTVLLDQVRAIVAEWDTTPTSDDTGSSSFRAMDSIWAEMRKRGVR